MAGPGDETTTNEHNLAGRVLTGALGAHFESADAVAATERALGQLHEQLTDWMGREGSYAVLARALDRARPSHPALADARVDFHGSPPRPRLTGLTGRVGDDPAATLGALVSLLGGVLSLLTRLIGANLVSRLAQQTWPAAVTDGGASSEPGMAPGLPHPSKRTSTSHDPDDSSRGTPQ
jgi:hypothetical protein